MAVADVTALRRRSSSARGFAGLERGGAADARRRARARARSARRGSAAARPRSPIARPASSSTTASTCCSAATPRRSRSCARSAPTDHVRVQPQLARDDDRSRRPPHRALSCPGAAARRCTCSPASSSGTRCRGAIGCRSLGMATPLRTARRDSRGGATASRRRPARRWRHWLIRNGQTPRLREMLWDPLALAALNQPPSEAAAPPFARVLAEMFGGDPRAAAIVLPTRPLHLMYAEPARDVHRAARRRRCAPARGARVASMAATRGVGVVPAERRRRRRVDLRRSRGSPSASCSTGDTAAARRRHRSRPRRRRRRPIVTVNLWFDRPRARRAVRRPAGARRCSGCSTSDRCSAATRRTCRSCRAARRRCSARSNDELIGARARRAARALPAGPRGALAARDGDSRAARDVFARARSAAAAATGDAGHAACSWPATGSTPVCPRRSRARYAVRARSRQCESSHVLRHDRVIDRPMTLITHELDRRPLQGTRAQGAEPAVVHPAARAQPAATRSQVCDVTIGPIGDGPHRDRARPLTRRRGARCATASRSVFGIANFSHAGRAPLDFAALAAAILADLGDRTRGVVSRVGDARRQAAFR